MVEGEGDFSRIIHIFECSNPISGNRRDGEIADYKARYFYRSNLS